MKSIESLGSRSIKKEGLSGVDKRAYNSLARNYVSKVYFRTGFIANNCEHLNKELQLLLHSPQVLDIRVV